MSTSVYDPVDDGFLEARAQLISLAAYLDRVERAGRTEDFRQQALFLALPLLMESGALRARRVLEHLSDASEEPIPVSPGKGACGAPPSAD